jgi:uncharacterized protein
VNVMRQEGEVTTVEVETDFTITGRLARFGRGGMIQDVSNRLLRDFSECLQHTIESAEPAAEAASEPTAGETPAESAQTAPAATQAARPAPRQAKPVGGLSLLLRVLVDRLKRLFGRG